MGATELASKVISHGTFVFRTAPSESPYEEEYRTWLKVCVTGLLDGTSITSLSKDSMDWETLQELAKKMVLCQKAFFL